MLPSRQSGFDVEEDVLGSKYEGDFVHGLKHGEGRYTWRSGEFYEGSFYKDYRHGDGVYFWPSGHTFIGKFYLNWREGYGQQLFPDGATFKGLYQADQRFGPGVFSESSGRQDVGLWYGKHLIQLCQSAQDSFSLKSMTGYAEYLAQTSASCYQSQPKKAALLYDDDTVLPSGIEYYSTDGDHLPFPPEKRREFDQRFYGQLWEPPDDPYQGYRRDPLSSLPMKTRMLAHIHQHRRLAGNLDWDIAAVLSLKRDNFGPNGPLEVTSERLIRQAAEGERQSVLNLLLDGLVHPDVADSQGHTALIGATVNCRDEVIDLLLDMGADIDKLNDEGMSALSVCHVLYYPFESLHTFSGLPAKAQNASQVVFLMVSHRARTDLLWSGHSPLSLAISRGNDLAVEQLLKGGADPNLPLACGVGNALCALSNFNYCIDGKRAKMLDMLEKAGVDMLMPVQVGDTVGNVVDYAHNSFNQDVRIANTPFHALNVEERETFQARCKLLSRMGDLLRQAAVQKQQLENRGIFLNDAKSNNQSQLSQAVNQRSPLFKFCHHCGRSVKVKLTACTRCRQVLYCSTTCKVKAWDKRHKKECRPKSGSQSALTLLPHSHTHVHTLMAGAAMQGNNQHPSGARVKCLAQGHNGHDEVICDMLQI